MLHKLFKKKDKPEGSESMIFEAQIGGYYTHKNKEGTWTIFRMLDFADQAIHCTLYHKNFDHKPSFEEAKATKPFILHAPLHKGSLFLSPDLELLGASPVEPEDLQGLMTYMEGTGYTQEQMEYVIRRIGSLQRAGKVKLKLTKIGDVVETEEVK